MKKRINRAGNLAGILIMAMVILSIGGGCGNNASGEAEVNSTGVNTQSSADTTENAQEQTMDSGDLLTMEGTIIEPMDEDKRFYLLPDGVTNKWDDVWFEAKYDMQPDQKPLIGDHVRVTYQEQENNVIKGAVKIELLEPVYEIKTVEGVFLNQDSSGPSIKFITEDTGEKYVIGCRESKKIALRPDALIDDYCSFLYYGDKVRVEYIETDDEFVPLKARIVEQLNDVYDEENVTVLEGVITSTDTVHYIITADDGIEVCLEDVDNELFDIVSDKKDLKKLMIPGTRVRLEYSGSMVPNINNTSKRNLTGYQIQSVEITGE